MLEPFVPSRYFLVFSGTFKCHFCDESKCLGSVMRPLSNTHLASAGWTLFRREQKRERRGGVEKNYQRKEIKKNWLGRSLFSLKKKTNQMLNWIFFGREENKAAQEWFPNYTFGGVKVQLREITGLCRSLAGKYFWNKEWGSKNICLNICVDLSVWGMVREEMGRSVPFRIGRSGEIELQCRWFAGITLPNRSQPHISPNFSFTTRIFKSSSVTEGSTFPNILHRTFSLLRQQKLAGKNA